MEVPVQGGISVSGLAFADQLRDVKSDVTTPLCTHLELNFEELLTANGSKKINLEALAKQYKIILAGHSLNLGSTDELNLGVLKSLRHIDQWLKVSMIHEALSWSTLSGHHTYLELPIPYTEANLELVVERVFRVQECLGRKLAVRNLLSHVQFVGAEFTPSEFLFELARITGCDLVLDQGALDWNAQRLSENLEGYSQLPTDFIRLVRVPAKCEKLILPHLDAPHIVYGSSLPEQLETLSRLPKNTSTGKIVTDRFALEATPRREVELKEGVFETEPRKILLDEVTRGFGIRANADLAIFENPEARDGLAIYNQQYFIQVRNVLQAQFRALSFMLSGSFDRIVADFLGQYPPTEAFIFNVGREFEYFLREDFESTLYTVEMLADMARLEFAMNEVMEEPDQPAIDPGIMMEIESGLWDRVIFKLNDQVRLVEAGFDVAKIHKNILSKGKMPEAPKSQKTHFLVYRKDEKPQVQMIGRPEAKALRYAWDEMTFIKICERITAEESLELDLVIQQTFSFIHRWAGLGLVKAFDFRAPHSVIEFSGSSWDHDA